MPSFESLLTTIYGDHIDSSQYKHLPTVLGKMHDIITLTEPKKISPKMNPANRKIDLSKVGDEIMQMHQGGKGYKDIIAHLKGEGYKVSEATLSRYINSQKLKEIGKGVGVVKEPSEPIRGRNWGSDDELQETHCIGESGLDYSDVSTD